MMDVQEDNVDLERMQFMFNHVVNEADDIKFKVKNSCSLTLYHRSSSLI